MRSRLCLGRGPVMAKCNPFYYYSTRREDKVMMICVTANVLLVVLCLTYLIAEYTSSGLSWIDLAAAIVCGYFIADFASGVVHWATDTWFTENDFGRAIAIAREHHTHPHHILGYRFIEHATLGSAPSAVLMWPLTLLILSFPNSVITYILMIFVFMVSLCLFFGTSFHNFGHKKARSPIIRLAQRLHLIITPEYHAVHHRGDQTVRYCTVNGWANYFCDQFKVWRFLEKIISELTGAQPREDDVKWQSYYKMTGHMYQAPRRRGFSRE